MPSSAPTPAQLALARQTLSATGLFRPRPGRKWPAEMLPALLATLEAEGFEPIPGGLRVPLAVQTAGLLDRLDIIPVPTFRKVLKGVQPHERRELIPRLAEAGCLKVVLRNLSVCVCEPRVSTLGPQDLRALAILGFRAGQALRKPHTSLLIQDLEQTLGLTRSRPRPVAPPPSGLINPFDHPDWASLKAAIRSQVDAETGLCSVPAVVVALVRLYMPSATFQALLQAHAEGKVELRPESGLGRLSPTELALCIPGPQETRLSWLRLLESHP